MKRPRAYAYARVSKVAERGDDLISPELQHFSMSTFAERNGIDIIESITDLDETGREFEKRQIQRMTDGIERSEADLVLVWKWSRWGRNLRKSLVYIAAVEAAGGTVRAAEEDFDASTTMGEYTRDQMLLIAQLQSNQISDGWKDTHARRRRLGLPHTRWPRFGYVDSRETGYVVDEALRQPLEDAYRRFASGAATMRAITREWNALGLRTTTGGPWTPVGVGRVLDTGFAAGLIRERSNQTTANRDRLTLRDFDIWRKGAHEPIISRELWDQYRDRRLENAAMPRRIIRATHALSGLVRCGICGGRMVTGYSGRSTDKRHVWRCSRAQQMRADHPGVAASNKKLERMVLDWITDLAIDPGEVEATAQRITTARQRVLTDVEALNREIVRLNAKRKRLADLMTDGAIEREDYDDQRVEITETLAAATASLRAASRTAATACPEPAIFESIAATWANALPEERANLIRPLIAEVRVFPGGWAEPAAKAQIHPAWPVDEP